MQYLAQAETDQTINTTIPYTAPTEESQSSSLLLPVISVAVIVVLVAVVLVWIMKRKKKPATTATQTVVEGAAVAGPVAAPSSPEAPVQSQPPRS